MSWFSKTLVIEPLSPFFYLHPSSLFKKVLKKPHGLLILVNFPIISWFFFLERYVPLGGVPLFPYIFDLLERHPKRGKCELYFFCAGKDPTGCHNIISHHGRDSRLPVFRPGGWNNKGERPSVNVNFLPWRFLTHAGRWIIHGGNCSDCVLRCESSALSDLGLRKVVKSPAQNRSGGCWFTGQSERRWRVWESETWAW